MEDGSKASHSMGGGGQQRNHPRPFFYVQPPSQPYYLPYQQWQMNNPYAQFAMPGGFNMARPCLNPYQYMQYPGLVYPHGPLYPVDYRRVFEPRFPHPGPHWDSSGARSSHHHQPPPPQEHREMTSAGAQTDPSDAISKLIERLDKLQTGEAQRSAQRADPELDSGVASSQSSTMFSPTEEKKPEPHPIVSQNPARSDSCLETPASTFSTIAVYDGDSSHRSLDCWGGAAEDEELPLDSSSVQEEQEPPEEQVVPIEPDPKLDDFQTDVAAADQSVPSSCEEQRLSKANPEEKTTESLQEDASFQILKLPFQLSSEAKAVSPLSPYYYNYLSLQSTHERLSVLSPSLDELSSRDEMFSTDLEEVELFPRRVYRGGRGLCGGGDEADEIWTLGSKRFVCACCGKSLPRGARSKVHCSKVYLDEGGDSDDDLRYVRGCEPPIRVVVRKHSGPRKTQPLPPRLTKSWSRRGPSRDQSRDQSSEQPEPGEPERRDSQEEEEERQEEQLHSSCQERLSRDEPDSDQNRWPEGAVRRRTTASTQRQELPQRKVLYHRPRDDDDEAPPLHWDRGAVTRDPPC